LGTGEPIIMEINSIMKGNAAIIQFTGSLDINNQDSFFEYFLSAMNHAKKTIALNFENVDYLDSSGIGMLVKCVGECKRRKLEFIIFGINEKIKQFFKIAKLTNFFPLLSTEEFKKKYLTIELDELDELI
jgi:anti-sigma B factor antagonist